ncbi:glycosyltransferase family 2 protein [Piscinibacter sp.]|jgi:glycosyltransferase involved in cell wall biosynthesis|uniref:glycosyltransferase family 2 protein n=1 Tax=Piscinibacter sp. TaxID=1903157 RepID=UPI002F407754
MFTIITATFNAGDLLDRTLASLRLQTDRDFQWIVVDGASTDSTVEKLCGAQDIVTWWISEPDRGIADAWNKGLDKAVGDYVLFLNAGDTYDPDFLERVRSRADGRRIVCSHARLLSEHGQQVGLVRAEPHKLHRAMHLPHNWCAVPRRWYDEFGPYALLPQAMDFEWFHRYYLRFGAAGFDVIDEALGEYHLGGTSDVNFAESYRAKERIIVANGGNALLARAFRWAYTLNHAIRRRGR